MMPRFVPTAVPALLSFVAGYIDSCMFLALFGLFVAQVTGSFVLTGVQFATHDPGTTVKVVGILAFFFAGVATTVMVRSGERRGQDALPAPNVKAASAQFVARGLQIFKRSHQDLGYDQCKIRARCEPERSAVEA
jgi:uncharacterized membrane protein YoaK (UPF0700 family)